MKLFPFCCFLRLCPCVYLPRGIKSQWLTNCLIQNIYTEEVRSSWQSHVRPLYPMIGQRDIMKLLDQGCWSMMAAYGAILAPKGRAAHFDLHHRDAETSHKSFYTVPFTHSAGTLLRVYSCKQLANQWPRNVVELYNYRVQRHIELCTAHASLVALIESRKRTLSGIQSSFFSLFLATISLAKRFLLTEA